MQINVLSTLVFAAGIMAAPQTTPDAVTPPANTTSAGSCAGTSTVYEHCNNPGTYEYGCNWDVRGNKKYITVGHSEKVNGTLVACGTTSTCTFGAFAKCKTKVGSWDVYESTPTNLNIYCVWKAEGEPNQGENDPIAIA